MKWSLPILARDSYADQRIELETPSAVLVYATDNKGNRLFVAVTKRGYTDFLFPVRGNNGELLVLYDRPEFFAASFRVNVKQIITDRMKEVS